MSNNKARATRNITYGIKGRKSPAGNGNEQEDMYTAQMDSENINGTQIKHDVYLFLSASPTLLLLAQSLHSLHEGKICVLYICRVLG